MKTLLWTLIFFFWFRCSAKNYVLIKMSVAAKYTWVCIWIHKFKVFINSRCSFKECTWITTKFHFHKCKWFHKIPKLYITIDKCIIFFLQISERSSSTNKYVNNIIIEVWATVIVCAMCVITCDINSLTR